jgi:hypothetical protein
MADWIDDHFGRNQYGVRFPSDGIIFPEREVSAAAIEWLVMDQRRPTDQPGDQTCRPTEEDSQGVAPEFQI